MEFEDRSISSAPGPPLTQSRTQSRRVDRSLVLVSTDSLSLASSNYKKIFNSIDFYWGFLTINIRVNWLFNHSMTLVECFLWPISYLRVPVPSFC